MSDTKSSRPLLEVENSVSPPKKPPKLNSNCNHCYKLIFFRNLLSSLTLCALLSSSHHLPLFFGARPARLEGPARPGSAPLAGAPGGEASFLWEADALADNRRGLWKKKHAEFTTLPHSAFPELESETIPKC